VDFAKWDTTLYTNKLPDPDSRKLAFTPKIELSHSNVAIRQLTSEVSGAHLRSKCAFAHSWAMTT